MPKNLITLAIAVLATTPPGVGAQTFDLGERSARLSRNLAPSADSVTGLRVVPKAVGKKSETIVSFGLERSKSQFGTRTVSVPLSLEHTPKDSAWTYTVSSRFVRASVPGASRLSGFSDLDLSAIRAFGPVVGVFGVTAPVRGDVGSRHWGSYGQLIHGGNLAAAVSYRVIGSAAHLRSDVPGVSAWSKGLYAELTVALIPDQHSVRMAIWRDHTAGDGGATTARGSYLYMLAPDTELSLEGTRGLTEGRKETTVGLNVRLTY